MLKNLLIIIFFFITFLRPISVWSVNMESSRYQIQFGNVNIAAGNMSSDSAKLSTTLGQLAANQFNSAGYIVKAGFQYIHSIIPFRFSISDTNIDLGSLMPSTPSTTTTTLTVSFGGAGLYSVTAEEEGPLQTFTGSSFIADTSCNGGANTCTEAVAKIWTSTSSYGFGYNMSGQDIPNDFINSTYYRPFPDQTAGEPPVRVMSSINVGKSRQATATFKANVSSIQAAGSYQTVINYVATPSF